MSTSLAAPVPLPPMPPPPGPTTPASLAPAVPAHRAWSRLPSVWVRGWLGDPLWLLWGVVAFIAWTWVHIAILTWAEENSGRSGFALTDYFFIQVIVWGFGLVLLTWWQATGWIERRDEGRRGSVIARLLPLRQHSWWLLLCAVATLGVTAGAWAWVIFVLGDAGLLRGGEAQAMLGIAAFVANYALFMFWIARRLYRLPARFARALGHGLVLAIGIFILWCGAVLLIYTMPEWLEALYRAWNLPELKEPQQMGMIDLALVSGAMAGFAAPYVLALSATWAWMLALVDLDRADDTPLHERQRGRWRAGQEADVFA